MVGMVPDLRSTSPASVALRPLRTVALVGIDGSGKTTLMLPSRHAASPPYLCHAGRITASHGRDGTQTVEMGACPVAPAHSVR